MRKKHALTHTRTRTLTRNRIPAISKLQWWAITMPMFTKCWLRRRSVVVSVLASINVVNRHWARLVIGLGDRLRAGMPSRYVASDLGQLSLPSLQGKSIEYRPVWLGLRRGVFTSLVSGGR